MKKILVNRSVEEAKKALNSDKDVLVFGYPFKSWENDFKTRLNEIQLEKNKRELKEIKEALEQIMSPELRASLELEKLQKKLSGLI